MEIRTRTTHSHGSPYKLETSKDVPPYPKSLKTHGKAIWGFVWTHAPVKPSDRLVVERFCRMHEHRNALLAVLDNDGIMAEGSMGQPVVHPAMRALAVLEPQIGRLEQVLGLSPEARARLNIIDSEEDEFDRFLKESARQE